MPQLRIAGSTVSGRGVFADAPIASGETVLFMTGERLSSREMDKCIDQGRVRLDDPFEVGGGSYILLDELPLCINHACEPNVGIRGENEVFALRDIAQNEELFYDYSTVVGDSEEGEEDWHMPCACGSAVCRQIIGNWRTLPGERLAYYRRHGAFPRFVLAQMAGLETIPS